MKSLFVPISAMVFSLCTSCALPVLNTFELGSGNGEPLRVLQVSDLHITSETKLLRDTMTRVNTLAPEILVFTGDLVESTSAIPLLGKYLSQIDLNCPKFAILGNWEYWGDVDLIILKEELTRYGIELLVNETRFLELRGRTLVIQGLDDYLGGSPRLDQDAFLPNATNIILAHCPSQFDATLADPMMADLSFLMLSGHTHGGQITFFGAPLVTPPGSGSYVAGLYQVGDDSLMVSRGIGTSIVPFRIFADPSIELIYLY